MCMQGRSGISASSCACAKGVASRLGGGGGGGGGSWQRVVHLESEMAWLCQRLGFAMTIPHSEPVWAVSSIQLL